MLTLLCKLTRKVSIFLCTSTSPREFKSRAATMSGNSPEFEAAAIAVRNMERPSNEDFLDLYGYYKQATVGDCNTDRPGMTDVSRRAMWDNWNSRKGTSKADAEKEYIATAKRLKVI